MQRFYLNAPQIPAACRTSEPAMVLPFANPTLELKAVAGNPLILPGKQGGVSVEEFARFNITVRTA
jgi:hypothetical protein